MAQAKDGRRSDSTRGRKAPEDRENASPFGLYPLSAGCARLLILALVTIAPWIYGCAQWQAQQAIVWVAAAIGLTTMIAAITSPRTLHLAHLTYFMLALLLIGSFQTVAWPSWFGTWLSSHAFVADAMQVGQDQDTKAAISNSTLFEKPIDSTISICSPRSRAALAVMAAGAIVLWASSILFASRRWAQLLVVTICVSGFANACLGLVQRVAWNNWSLLEFPSASYYSTFVSRNSAPDYFAAALGGLLILLASAYRSRKRARRQSYRMTYPSITLGGKIRNRMEDLFIDLDTRGVVCLCAIALLTVSALATYSRGGTMAMLGAGLILLSLTFGTKSGPNRSIAATVSLFAVAILILTALNLDDELLTRFNDLNQLAYEGKDGRLTAWSYSLSAMAWYWTCGSGLCTYQFAILPFHDGHPAVWFQHAENLYLEIGVEFGAIGLCCTVAAVVYLVRDLLRESVSHKEDMLFAGVGFLVFVLILHSFVDFSLILPGVFLPAAAFVGAFDGRVRRSNSEQKRSSSEEQDARLSHNKDTESPKAAPVRWPAIICVAFGCTCLLIQWRGSADLAGFAHAEKLLSKLEHLEERAAKELIPNSEVQVIESQAAQLVARHPRHPDANLAAGRAELFTLRCKLLTTERELDKVESHASRWQLTHPHATLTLLAVPSTDPILSAIQSALQNSHLRQQLLTDSLEHFKVAISCCPMDTRAAWGIYLSGLGQMSNDDEKVASALLMLLSRNNPSVLFKSGLAAITASTEDSSRRKQGMQLLSLSIALDESMLFRGLPTVLAYLTSEQIVRLLPNDIVLLAKTARTASGILPEGKDLSNSLLRQIATDLPKASAKDVYGWSALAWAATELDERPLAIRLLRRTLISGEDNLEIREQLAELLLKNGQPKEAYQEIEIAIAKYPSSEGELRSLWGRWNEQVDRKP